MRSLRKDEVNKRHSYTWVKINDDAMSSHWKKEFLNEFGGEFIQDGKNLRWQTKNIAKEPAKRKIIVRNPEGSAVQIENFAKYCRENNLSKSAMYEVLSGKRSQHKGFRAVTEQE